MPSANEVPRRASAFGGSSSVSSSTSSDASIGFGHCYVVLWSGLIDIALDLQRRRPRGLGGFLCVGDESGCGVYGIAQHGETERFTRLVIALCDRTRQIADPADISRALRHRNRAARVQQVERVAGFQHEFVRGQRELRFDHLLASAS